jgi:hypothetical protein
MCASSFYSGQQRHEVLRPCSAQDGFTLKRLRFFKEAANRHIARFKQGCNMCAPMLIGVGHDFGTNSEGWYPTKSQAARKATRKPTNVSPPTDLLDRANLTPIIEFGGEKFVLKTPFPGAIRTDEPDPSTGTLRSDQTRILAALGDLFGAFCPISLHRESNNQGCSASPDFILAA